MAPHYRLGFRRSDEQREDANRQTMGLAALCVVLCLVVVSLFLVKHLHAVGAIEDCLLAAHSNCDILVSVNH